MRTRFPDWAWAGLGGACLFGAALYITFVIRPFGFEETIGYWLILPGVFPGDLVTDHIFKFAPKLAATTQWPLIIAFTFASYWGFAFSIVKPLRLCFGARDSGPGPNPPNCGPCRNLY